MLIFPAIDLKDGKAVRLRQGDFGTVHQVARVPMGVALCFRDAGAKFVHVVDLDGAKDGVRKNRDIVRAIAGVGLKVQLGGGLRSLEDIEEVFSLGVWRAVLGTAAVEDRGLVKDALAKFGPDRIAVGIDAMDGRVRTAGWTEDGGMDALALAKDMDNLGVQYLTFTDIASDGLLAGPSFQKLEALRDSVGCHITASGGVGCNEDIYKLRDMGLYGAIVGKAWYTGDVDLDSAVRECGPQI